MSTVASHTGFEILSLYRSLLRNAKNFEAYNFREYAIRRTKDAFRQHMSETDPEIISSYLLEAHQQLALLQRQTVISQMYKFDKVVIEGATKKNAAHSS
ncbi:hypothetical protein V1512DRAFT_260378 [Lipomyces arxii]|uniref:uncharacterized protein n=1 Tax=Lipomyces arxii TaxID=56418 RepID=UPI0034CD3240